MKVNTLWQIMDDRLDKIIIRIEHQWQWQPTYRQEYLPNQSIPQFIWDEEVANWHLLHEADGRKVLVIDLWGE